MEHRPVHLHSMLVHGVVAFAPLAAAAYLLEAGSVVVAGIGPEVWAFLLRGSLVAMLVLALPSALTGIFERNHMYVNWPPSHRVKLVLSVVLVVLTVVELAALLGRPADPIRVGSWLAAAIVVGNCAAVLGLSAYGLRISLGRQSLAPTSYRPDMDLDPPVDIVERIAELAVEEPRLIDVRGEG